VASTEAKDVRRATDAFEARQTGPFAAKSVENTSYQGANPCHSAANLIRVRAGKKGPAPLRCVAMTNAGVFFVSTAGNR
jgi:hypothetical protein